MICYRYHVIRNRFQVSTISDVARRAGVSTMTVSRVINNSGYASLEVRERVLAAVGELGYVPNALARSLHIKRTHTLALVLTDIGNPFFTTLARGVEDAASGQGFSVMFCNTDESEEEETAHVRLLLQKQVDGLLLVPAKSASQSVELARQRGVPVVVLDRRLAGAPVDAVRCDSEAGAHAIVRHLIELGHREIAILSAAPDVSVAADRIAGACRAMNEAGLSLDDSRVMYGRPETASGKQMARAALRLSPQPTALFATNNFITIGAFAALRDAGLRVPEDISLAGFDDLPEPLILDPFLTVVAQPAYEMGRRGAELLLERLIQGAPDQAREIVLPTELVIRRSTARPSASSGRA
jgi:LacI family transcriptional regulator